LDRLFARDVAVAINGPAALEFLFERVVATRSQEALRRDWVAQVARLLDQIEPADPDLHAGSVALAS
jgi:hypothetical protein